MKPTVHPYLHPYFCFQHWLSKDEQLTSHMPFHLWKSVLSSCVCVPHLLPNRVVAQKISGKRKNSIWPPNSIPIFSYAHLLEGLDRDFTRFCSRILQGEGKAFKSSASFAQNFPVCFAHYVWGKAARRSTQQGPLCSTGLTMVCSNSYSRR